MVGLFKHYQGKLVNQVRNSTKGTEKNTKRNDHSPNSEITVSLDQKNILCSSKNWYRHISAITYILWLNFEARKWILQASSCIETNHLKVGKIRLIS